MKGTKIIVFRGAIPGPVQQPPANSVGESLPHSRNRQCIIYATSSLLCYFHRLSHVSGKGRIRFDTRARTFVYNESTTLLTSPSVSIAAPYES